MNQPCVMLAVEQAAEAIDIRRMSVLPPVL